MKTDEILKKIEEHEPGHIGRFKQFSVLIPLIEREKDVNVLYQVRGSRIKRQPGEISFPGGARENGESAMDCAVRETCEELLIEASSIHHIQKIAVQHTWRGDEIHVFSGIIDSSAVDGFIQNVEVAELFEVPMEWLLEYEPIIHTASASPGFDDGFDEGELGFPEGYPWGTLRSEQPMYYFEGRIIWGITGRITKYLIDIIKE